MDDPRNNRITVSEDKLDSKLAALELRLVDRITQALEAKADEAVVRQIRDRLHLAEGSIQAYAFLVPTTKDIEDRTRRLERFRYAVPSAAVISAVAAISSVIALYLHG